MNILKQMSSGPHTIVITQCPEQTIHGSYGWL